MKTIGLGLLGGGTVGGGLAGLLRQNGDAIAARTGVSLAIRRVAVRDLAKARPDALAGAALTTDPTTVVDDPSVDVVVELLGGLEPAGALVVRALEAKKSVVTANKALLAARGPELLALARRSGVDLAFEGSVGGGIPIVRALRQSFAGDRVTRVSGILNGTSNYVLTRMRRAGLSLADAVREAQELGYAEADPTADLSGADAAHKLAVLALLAFGVHVPPRAIPTYGIDAVSADDHRHAARFGFVVRPLAFAARGDAGVSLGVYPALVPEGAGLGAVDGVLNAVDLEGEAVGPSTLVGRGAGAGPTAVSVLADALEIAVARAGGGEGVATRALGAVAEATPAAEDALRTRHYLRVPVRDEPGVLAALAAALGDERVSIAELVQGKVERGPVDVVVLTHPAEVGAVRRALARIEAAPFADGRPCWLRVHA